jgi:peptidoglycan hydrolase-like protein with peptidoglycan-binding domain
VKLDLKRMRNNVVNGDGLALGDKGKGVAALQRHLASAGLLNGRSSGTFDASTEVAVERLQRHAKLGITGKLDPGTFRAVRRLDRFVSGFDDAARVGERGRDVHSLERNLKTLGYRPGKVDGIFDESTARAVTRFQRRNGLERSGRVGTGTARAMDGALELRRLLRKAESAKAYRSGSSFHIRVIPVDGKQVEVRTALAYFRMRKAAARDGVHLKVVSGFRTYAKQQQLYNQLGPKWAARPGYSNHQSGVALDLNTGSFGSRTYNWLVRHGPRFGFRRTVPHEHWHFEYRR